MENSTVKTYLGYAGVFALGAIASHLLFKKREEDDKEEPVSKEEKKKTKVTFDNEVLKLEELKEVIKMVVKETIAKLEDRLEINIEPPKPKKFQKTPETNMRRKYSASEEPIYKICFTGGPCAGKTTALSLLNSQVDQLGFRPFIVPEAATLLMKSGFLIDNAEFTEVEAIQFQS